MEHDGKGVLFVPIEVIPEQMSMKQFLEGWKNKNPDVMEIIETKCKYVDLSSF